MELILVIIFTILSGVFTYKLGNIAKVGPVFASIFVSSILIFMIFVISKIALDIETHTIYKIIYGASFVGMTSDKRINSSITIGIISLLFLIILLAFSNIFKGFGGGLGTSAFIAVGVAISLQYIFNKVVKR